MTDAGLTTNQRILLFIQAYQEQHGVTPRLPDIAARLALLKPIAYAVTRREEVPA